MANFIGLVYATLKENGIDTKGMSTDEAVAKFKELQGEGKEEKKDTPEDVKKKLGEKKEEEPSEIKDKSIKKEEKKEDSFERKTSFEDNREIDWDLAEKNEKINGKNAKNPKRHDKYGNELLSDEAFKIGLEAGKSHLDYMLQYNTISSLKRSNVFLRGLQETINNAITNNGFNPNLDTTYTDYNEIIGNLLGEEVDVEKDELRIGNPYTGREYIGYKPK